MLGFLVLAIVFTRPLLTEGNDHTYKDPYDPTLQAWTLAWDTRALTSEPFDLFNANIFFPNPYTLAYSDAQVVTAVLSMPIRAVTGNPLQTSNYMVIFNFFLCEVGAYFLVLHLTGSRAAGVVAGIAYAFAPPRLAHMGHLQITAAAFIPLALLFLHRFSEEGKPRDAALFGLFAVLQTLSTWYYGLILGFAVIVFLIVRLVMRPKAFTLKWVGTFLLVLVVSGAVVAPFARPYLKVHETEPRFERKVSEVDLFSPDIRDYAIAPQENLIWGSVTSGLREETDSRGGQTERSLFTGLVPLLLGIAGAVYLFARGRGAARFDVRFYVTLVAASFVMSLGTSLYLFGHRLNIWMPYEFFYRFFPGFKAMRVPGRFVILIGLSLAVLSGFAVKGIVSYLSRYRGSFLPALACIVIVALLLADLMSVNLPMFRVPTDDEFPSVYTWLKEQPGEAPTAELPLADYDRDTFTAGLQYEPTWAPREALRTYYSTLHWKKLFNGYSGYIPDSYYRGVRAARDFPSQEAVDFFRGEGVEYLIVHGKELESARLTSVLAWDEAHDDMRQVGRFGTDYVFSIR